jgi:hypothetical protein
LIKKYYLDELKGEDKREGPRINEIERVSIINKNIISDKDDVKVINKIKQIIPQLIQRIVKDNQ